ncbi:MAG: hypothetical protein NVV63_12530 [Opitutus sp.]|nr:hypothetical protein [Opitutus sp.]
MSSPDQVIISGKVHSPFQHNGVVGYRPIEPPMPVLDKVPLALWSGAPIPVSLWREVLAFFKWSYDTTKSETQVRLFYHFHRGEWRAHAFPQEKNSGMTTKELPDHPNMAADMKAILDDGFTVWGTVHHHCAAQAFQSGTDLSDEQGQAGIHITVGNMDKPEHSIHRALPC